MIIWGMLTWWYTEGWHQCLLRAKERLDSVMDYFSIGLLLTTLFAPFRQISAGSVQGPVDVQMRAFVDRLVSRFIGAVVRLIMIGAGVVAILLNIVVSIVLLLGWMLLPLLPLAGMVLFIVGWMPWSK